MSDVDQLLASPDRCVTASELVRQFGAWQERALQNPVFVLRRGRPSLVLTSLDLMRRLCAPHQAPESAPLLDLLLDAMRESVIVVDGAGRVVRANRACRIAFPGGGIGSPIGALMPDGVARLLLELAERARRSGSADQADVTIGGRQMNVAIVPMAEGGLYVAADISADIEADHCEARLSAIEAATDLFDDVAWARIDLRGYMHSSSATLARMTAIDPATLQAARFVTLVDLQSRSMVGDAIDAVIADGAPRRLDVRLHGAQGAVFDVRLALASEQSHGRCQCLTALIHVDRAAHMNLKS